MSQQATNAGPRFEGSVAPAFPLALLESIRAHDRPAEILEDEDLTVSLPRRLGLTGVVETQIMRYETAARNGGSVRLDEVISLLRLVMRRPDAEPILRETGQRIARWRFRRVPRAYITLLHRAPNRLGMRSARRAAARALRTLRLGGAIEAGKPFALNLRDSATAAVDQENPACTLVSGMLEEQIRLFTGLERRVRHPSCEARGGARCEWVVEAGDAAGGAGAVEGGSGASADMGVAEARGEGPDRGDASG